MKPIHHLLAFATVALLVASCSNSSTPQPDSGTATDSATTAADSAVAQELLTPPETGKGVQIKMVSPLASGVETERCAFYQVPAGGLYVNRAVTRYTPGSHHVLLFRTEYTTMPTENRHGKKVDTSGIVECPEGASADWKVTGVIAGAQSPNAPDVITLPEGIGIPLKEGEVLVINTHYINTTSETIMTDARINLHTIPKEQVKTEAGILFFYNPYIYVPANGTGRTRISCPVQKDITLLNGQSHMHRRGVGYVANLVDNTGAKLEQLYENTKWEDVPVKFWEGGKALKTGQSIDYQCEYKNTENRNVIQGFTTKDEMCMFLGVYYPRDAATELCSIDGTWDNFMTAATAIGTGTATGAVTAECLKTAKAGYNPTTGAGVDKVYKCIVESCPGVSKEMKALMACSASAQSDFDCINQFGALQAKACE